MITVIYDGQCRFCRACLAWLENKLEVTTLAYQEIDTTRFGLTKAQCIEQVHIENHGQVVAGAAAVATLLRARGNTNLANLIFWSGPLGRIGYRWVASNRNSWAIKSATKVLERKANRV